MVFLFSLKNLLNIIIAVAFFIYWGVVFVILYHLTRFGIGTQPKRFAAIFFLGSIILFSLSIILYLNVDTSSFL